MKKEQNKARAQIINKIKLTLPAISENEALARQIICSFASRLDPTTAELSDLRIIISEAVTNCVVHAYKGSAGDIYISGTIYSDRHIKLVIKDKGCGISDIEKSMEPFFTTDTDTERGGMGLPIMKELSSSFKLRSTVGHGTVLTVTKKLSD